MAIEWDDGSVEWDDAPKHQLSNPRAQAESVLATMNPAEQTLAAIGGGMYSTGRNVGNFLGNVAERVTGKRFGMPTDDEIRESEEIRAPLAENNKIASFAGELAPQIPLIMAGGGGAVASRAGTLSRLANIGKQTALGAGQGYLFSAPDQRESNALLGGAIGGGVATFANPIAALARNAGKRASKIAVDLFEPDAEKLTEIVMKYGKPGDTVEEAVRRAGSEIRAARTATGARLIDPVEEAGQYTARASSIGARGGSRIDAAMRYADEMGLKGSPAEIRAQLLEAKRAVVGPTPFNRLTPHQRAASDAIDQQIAYFDEVFGTKARPGAVNPGVQPEVTRPLQMKGNVRSPEGDFVIGESRVGAAASQPTRVFDPPAITGRVSLRDPTTNRFVKGGQVPAQPHLQASRVVDIPEEAWSPWRSFVARQQGRTYPGTNRPRPLARNQYAPQEVVQEGVPGVGAPFQQVEFVDQPLSAFEIFGKRPFGVEGYLRKGSGAFRSPTTAAADPGVQFFQRGTGILKEGVESRLPSGVRERFMLGKQESQLGKVFGEAADENAIRQLTPRTGQTARGSPTGLIWNKMASAAIRRSRPYQIKFNEALEKALEKTPHNTDAAIRAAVIEMLRED